MPDTPSPPAAALGQRKLVAMVGAAVLLGGFTLAFMLGGKKAPAAKDTETYFEIGKLDGSSIDLNTQALPDNWVDNTVPGAEVAATAPSTNPASAQRSSSVIHGDGPGAQTQPSGARAAPTTNVAGTPPMPVEAEPHAVAVAAADAERTQAAPKPATTTGGGAQMAQATPTSGTTSGGSGEAGAQVTGPATTTAGSAKMAQATPTSGTTSGGNDNTGAQVTSTTTTPAGSAQMAQTTSNSGRTSGGGYKAAAQVTSPSMTTGGSVHMAQTAPNSGTASGGRDKAGTRTASPASTSVTPQTQASSPAAPPAIPVKVAKAAAEDGTSSKPVFVRPVQKRPGVVAQTRTLITEKQYAPAAASKPAAGAKDAGTAPARVRQQDARSYAQQATRQLQKQKVLPPTQHVRLPRRAETTNPAVWHEDDTPATADERRPFGLVVAEEKPGFTPEGIPVRTDIPAGTSPLQQNGPDKPLWKRPE